MLSALLKAQPGADDDLMKALQAQLASAQTIQVRRVPCHMLGLGIKWRAPTFSVDSLSICQF